MEIMIIASTLCCIGAVGWVCLGIMLMDSKLSRIEKHLKKMAEK
jgi:hypothetical protein